jgi:competence protein ComX
MEITETEFGELFLEMKPIVYKLMRQFRIPSWSYDDYFQEGMITLHELVSKIRDDTGIYTKFKVQYHQHLIDVLRRARAQKRSFDCMDGLDIYESSDWIPSKSTSPEQELIYEFLFNEVERILTPRYQRLLLRQMSGEPLTRMEKYRLKQKIKEILYGED